MRRRMINTLVGWLMLVSLFCTGFAATITLHPPTSPSVTGNVSAYGPSEETLLIDPAYYGISWKNPSYIEATDGEYKKATDGTYVPIADGESVAKRYKLEVTGQKLSYKATTAGTNTVYAFKSKTLSAQININRSKMNEHLKSNDYWNDSLLLNLEIRGFTLSDTSGLRIPSVATVGLPDESYEERVGVTQKSDGTLEIKIAISTLYSLAGFYKTTSATEIPIAIRFEFEDSGMASADIKAVCDARQIFTISTVAS